MQKKHLMMSLLMVGTNLATAVTIMSISQKRIEKQHELLKMCVKNTEIYRGALEKFASNTPAEISKPIVDDLAFEWVVRDIS